MGDAELRQWFEAIDIDKSGSLDPAELQRALALGNLHFSLITCSRIIRIHDKDNSGTINFEEFRGMHEFLMDVQKRFSDADNEKKGRLDKQAVERLLQEKGYRLDAPAFAAAFSAYNPERNGTVDMTEFIALTLFMSAATSVFTAFDSQRSGRVEMNFDQFVFATANVV